MAAITCDICGGSLSMDASGDFAVCESCGMKHTKDRVKAKAQEITGTVKVSNVTHYKDIFEAAQKGIVQDVAYFIENGTDVNAKGFYDRTPLFHAVSCNSNVDVVKYLVSKGADVNAKDEKGNPLLHGVMGSRGVMGSNVNTDAVKYLISKGADISAKDENGNSLLYTMFNHYQYDLDLVKCLISNGVNVNEEGGTIFGKTRYGGTPLDMASKSKSVPMEVVEYLISAGAYVSSDHVKDADRPEIKRILIEAIGKAKYPQLVQAKNNASTENDYQFLAESFRDLNGYKDTSELARECENQYRVLKERREEQEREQERREQEENKRRNEEELSKRWQSQGLCPLCGGHIGGIFTKKCKSCGMEQ